ncbi:rhodanese-like domain-containing protein [Desulfobacula sp.]|uniref:rhodanese-like domain-containing protein n=1 Tax=Desulfobacula sp. TaxID=2593537 RepID=UPI0026323CD6|nr:rhodanese-like domain-containing protein [Desulfobacula sp.]
MLNTQILKKMEVTDDLNPNQAMDLISKGNQNLVILDVCTAKEFKDRHLENAVNHSFISRSFKSVINSLDKTKAYLVYCTVGGRSKIATKLMKQLGFQKVHNLIGGTLLWEEFEYPFAENANKVHGFSICPILNSMLIVKKSKRLLSSGYKKIVRSLGITKIECENENG